MSNTDNERDTQILKDVESFLAKYDTNKDSRVTKEEMIQSLRASNKKNPERIADFLFGKNDTDGDGSLSISEIRIRAERMNIWDPVKPSN